MARKKRSDVAAEWKEMIAKDEGLREVIQGVVREVLEAEMDEAPGAGKWERNGCSDGGIELATTQGLW
jgi:transposase-like protein